METKLIAIGNSQGVRIPRLLIKQYHFEDGVEIQTLPDGIFIKPIFRKRRAGWEEDIIALKQTNPNVQLDDEEWLNADLGEDVDEEDFEWN
jgi:antitoxin MazE